MNILSRLFGGRAKALATATSTIHIPDGTWQGLEIQSSASYSLSLIGRDLSILGKKKQYAHPNNVPVAAVEAYPILHPRHVDGVQIGRDMHEMTNSPMQALDLKSPYQIWNELKKQSKGESLLDVRESGIGTVDLINLSFDLRVLSRDSIKKLIDYKRDEAIFNAVQSPEERSLFRFRQTSGQLLLADSREDRGPIMVVQKYGQPLAGGKKHDYIIDHYFETTADFIDKLTKNARIYDGIFTVKPFLKYAIVGVDNLQIKPQPLPAELLQQLKRQTVLNRLKSGLQDRLLGVEQALLQEIRQNTIKITACNGADESNNTAKSEYLWLTIRENKLRGTIVAGEFKDCTLAFMKPEELRRFYDECKHDQDSRALCEAYLRYIDFEEFRRKKEWSRTKAVDENEMSMEEACAALGIKVPEGNDIIPVDDIKAAFRKSIKESGHDAGTQDKTEAENETIKHSSQRIVQARDVLIQRFG